jgi:hypothetical protein
VSAKRLSTMDTFSSLIDVASESKLWRAGLVIIGTLCKAAGAFSNGLWTPMGVDQTSDGGIVSRLFIGACIPC